MNNVLFRRLLAVLFEDFHAFYGDNIGTYDDLGSKVNYKETSVYDEEGQRTYTLDVDVWCLDSVYKETVCNQIETLLNYKSYPIEDKWSTFIFESRYNADEKEVYRTTLTFEVRTW